MKFMYGYVFLAKNHITGEQWVGINRAVAFNKHFFGDSDKVIDAVNKYGITKFSVDMLSPAESEEALIALEKAYKAKYEVKSISEPEEPAPVNVKKSRKKKTEEDE